MAALRDRVKDIAPKQVREGVREAMVRYGTLTSGSRPLPDFLIIGTKRGGTTSLWRYLIQHPLVPQLYPAWNTKASHYFEENWHRGESWYRSHFPTERQRAALGREHGGTVRVGESAPLYMFHPLAHERVHALMPNVRLIVLMRDPVERAYSHWKERTTEGKETLGFGAALAAEDERTAGEREKLIADPNYFSEPYDWYTYRARGRYLDHLAPWLATFDREQMLVMTSETFYAEPAEAYRNVLSFVGLPPHELSSYPAHNDRPSAEMDQAVRAELRAYYRPHNEALADALSMRLDWQ